MTAEKSANKEQKSIRLNENSSNALKIHNPCHRKIYVPMITDDDVKVGMKEILQHPTKLPDGTSIDNPPIPVYDTSGPTQMITMISISIMVYTNFEQNGLQIEIKNSKIIALKCIWQKKE